MLLAQEISQAIDFHLFLKLQMREAVATGKSRHTVEGLCRDDQSKLGKWLYNLDDSVKATPQWKCVRDLHVDFHREAGRVLEIALSGDAASARSAISYSSHYAGIARRFESELTAWKREVGNSGAKVGESTLGPRALAPAVVTESPVAISS